MFKSDSFGKILKFPPPQPHIQDSNDGRFSLKKNKTSWFPLFFNAATDQVLLYTSPVEKLLNF